MKKEVLIILAVGIAIACVVFFLILPAYDAVGVLSTSLEEEKAKLEEAQNIDQNIKELADEYEQNAKEIEKLMAILPKKEELASLLVQLEALAGAHGLFMGSVDFVEASKKSVKTPRVMPEADDLSLKSGAATSQITSAPGSLAENYKTLQVSLKLSGGYAAFKKYLEALEKNVRLMDVSSLNVSSNSASGVAGQNFSFSVSVNVYYQ